MAVAGFAVGSRWCWSCQGQLPCWNLPYLAAVPSWRGAVWVVLTCAWAPGASRKWHCCEVGAAAAAVAAGCMHRAAASAAVVVAVVGCMEVGGAGWNTRKVVAAMVLSGVAGAAAGAGAVRVGHAEVARVYGLSALRLEA